MSKLTITDLILLFDDKQNDTTSPNKSINTDLSALEFFHSPWHPLTRHSILTNTEYMSGVYILGLRIGQYVPAVPIYVSSGKNVARRLKYWDNRLKPNDKYKDAKVIGRTLMLYVPRGY